MSSDEDSDYEYISDSGSVPDEENESKSSSNNLKQSSFQTLRQVSYDVIDEEKLDLRKKSLVDEVSSVLSITQCEASLLLMNYKWNKDHVISEWFADKVKCCSKAGLIDESLGKATILNGGKCCLCNALPKALLPKEVSTKSKQTKKVKKPKKVKPGIGAITKQLKAMKKRKMKFSFPKGQQDVFHLQFPIECRGMWTGITYTFDVSLPKDYPFSPPVSIECNEYRNSLHPNIDPKNGNVCINSLRENW